MARHAPIAPLTTTLVLAVGLWATSSRATVPIVYSRCPRAADPVVLSGTVKKGAQQVTASTTVQSGDLYEMLPDTSKQRSGFVAPCDLVYRDAAGSERILYSCIGQSTPDKACAALDPAVSFDGKTIAFAVFRGTLEHLWASVKPTELDPAAENTDSITIKLPGYGLQSVDAQLYLVDVASGALTALPHEPGVFDFGPTWMANGRLGFTTDRSNTYSTMPLCTNTNPRVPQFASFALDGRDLVRPSPHALAAELHPYPLRDGRILLSSWQLFGMLAYGHPNAVGSCGTLNNKFHLYAVDPDGSRQMAVYGQHLDDPTYEEHEPGFDLRTHMSAHFLTQSTDGRVWVGEYYRDNNLGLGNISGFDLPPDGQEGLTVDQADAAKVSAYRPPNQVQLASWASNADQEAALMPAPPMTVPGYAAPLRYAGKLGHPAAAPGNQLVVTWGKGACTAAIGKTFVAQMKDYKVDAGDNPYCDTGIYLTPALPPTKRGSLFKHPSEFTPIVDRREFHEFFARVVLPYKDVIGVDAPAKLAPAVTTGRSEPELGIAVPYGLLGAASILHRETKPHGGKFLFEGFNQMSHVGTDLVDYTDDELCGVRVLAVMPNRKEEYKKNSTSPASERLAILGEFAVRKQGSEKDALGDPDTSFRVRIPADVPYIMQGIDCRGRTLNTDQTWQHLTPGEFRTCNGCHVHSAAADALPFKGTLAGLRKVTPARLGEGKVPLLVGESGGVVQTTEVTSWGVQIEFERDVMPIFAKRCVSCHGAGRADAGLRLDIPRTPAMREETVKDDSSWARLALDLSQTYVPSNLRHPAAQGVLAKPNLSKYVRLLNARGSLLYWKAANQRTDGRRDSDYPSAPKSGVTNKGEFDVDFGATHPTTITSDELGTLARWIDLGAMWGPDAFEDTIGPTLALEGSFDGSTLTGLVVGTTDVGSGIAPSSLTACVVRGAGSCIPIANTPPAAMAGTVTFSMAPLSEPTDEVEVSVADLSGNRTTLRRTIRALANLPPPVPGPGGDGASAPGDDGCSCTTSGRSAPSTAALAAWIGLTLMLGRRRRR